MEFINHFGSVKIEQENDIIIGRFSGNLNERLVYLFSQHIIEKVSAFSGKPWAYICDSLNVTAATPEAEHCFVELTKRLLETKCVVSAYVLQSPLAINQMNKILLKSGSATDLSQCLFNDFSNAKDFVLSKLHNYKVA